MFSSITLLTEPSYMDTQGPLWSILTSHSFPSSHSCTASCGTQGTCGWFKCLAHSFYPSLSPSDFSRLDPSQPPGLIHASPLWDSLPNQPSAGPGTPVPLDFCTRGLMIVVGRSHIRTITSLTHLSLGPGREQCEKLPVNVSRIDSWWMGCLVNERLNFESHLKTVWFIFRVDSRTSLWYLQRRVGSIEDINGIWQKCSRSLECAEFPLKYSEFPGTNLYSSVIAIHS
jgi:hypothetical protein